ncbi:hypothetical protein K3495_g4045 [Podosphaera aphanis]|nr:hypothetical protein K3495_g4045 [Podosphaera aphanis]
MAVKAVNDTAGPNGLVPTLLFFGSYPRIPSDQPTVTPDVKQRAMAIQKAMKELRVIMDRRKNGDDNDFQPSTDFEIEAGRGNKVERSCGAEAHSKTGRASEVGPSTSTTTTAKRGRGRPKVSKGNTKPPQNDNFLSTNEIHDLELAKQLRCSGKITTPGEPFEASDRKEVNALIAVGTFQFEQYDPFRHTDQIFNSRMVREIKNKNTESPYEKSRLVVQGFNDEGKSVILTQS